MALHVPGVGASVTGISHSTPTGPSSKERYVYGILSRLEQEENTLTRITGRTDRITITANLSTRTANIDLLVNVAASIVATGITQYTAAHYLTGSTFASGTGGHSTALNLAQAAMEAVIALKLIELDKARNPQNRNAITRCTHTVAASGATNATFSALLELPIEIINLPGGGSVIEGRNYLT